MSRSGASFGRLMSFIILGLLMGGILGESLGMLFGELGNIMNAGGHNNLVRNFFIEAWNLNLGFSDDGKPMVIDLYMMKFHLAASFKFNIVSIIGMVASLYVMKWSGDR
jgi:hypothetical protein